MSDRLTDLQRQRALIQEHQEWLEREIARETGIAAPLRAIAPEIPTAPPASPAVDADADRIIAQYRSPKPIKNEVRTGCFLYLFAAFAVVGLGIVVLYLFGTR